MAITLAAPAPRPVAAAIAKQTAAVTSGGESELEHSLPPRVTVGVASVARTSQRASAVSRRRGTRLQSARVRARPLILIAIPGPSVLFVISRGVVLGRRAALATVLGNCAGVYVPGGRRRARPRRDRRALGRGLQHGQARRRRSTSSSSGSDVPEAPLARRGARAAGRRRRATAASCARGSSSGSRTRRRRSSSRRSCRSSPSRRSGTCRCRCSCSGLVFICDRARARRHLGVRRRHRARPAGRPRRARSRRSAARAAWCWSASASAWPSPAGSPSVS